MFMIEKFYRQTVAVISAISVLVIVVLASGEVEGSGFHTLTAFAETNSGIAEAAEESLEEKTKEAENGQLWTKDRRDRESGQREHGTGEVQTEGGAKTGPSNRQLKEKIAPKEDGRESQEMINEAAVVPCSQEDYQILLRIVEAEAGICDDTGKVLVANVIINRVRDQEFPNTIKDVVYQKYQFSPVANGTINTCEVTQQTIDCVNRALKGEDYSQGALYFMNRRGARPGAADWFDGRLTYLFRHERHEFFK